MMGLQFSQQRFQHNINSSELQTIERQESPPAWTQEAYRPPRSHSKSLLFRGGGGGGSLDKTFFAQSEHVSSQIWCQKFFPLLGGEGGPSTKKIFPSLNMYQAKSGVKNFSLYWGGTMGTPSDLRPGTPPGPETGTPQTWDWDPPWTWDWDPPKTGTPQTWDWDPPHLDLRWGTSRLGVDWQTENSTFPHPSDAGGKNCKLLMRVFSLGLNYNSWFRKYCIFQARI